MSLLRLCATLMCLGFLSCLDFLEAGTEHLLHFCSDDEVPDIFASLRADKSRLWRGDGIVDDHRKVAQQRLIMRNRLVLVQVVEENVFVVRRILRRWLEGKIDLVSGAVRPLAALGVWFVGNNPKLLGRENYYRRLRNGRFRQGAREKHERHDCDGKEQRTDAHDSSSLSLYDSGGNLSSPMINYFMAVV
jgi:hypothetical protein